MNEIYNKAEEFAKDFRGFGGQYVSRKDMQDLISSAFRQGAEWQCGKEPSLWWQRWQIERATLQAIEESLQKGELYKRINEYIAEVGGTDNLTTYDFIDVIYNYMLDVMTQAIKKQRDNEK